MNVTIISDDQYYGPGTAVILEAQGIHCIHQNWKAFTKNNASDARRLDAVVVDVGGYTELWKYRALLHYSGPLLFVIDIIPSILNHDRLFVSKKEGAATLLQTLLLLHQRKIQVLPQKLARGFRSLQYFNAGIPVHQIALKMNRCEKSILRLKNDVVMYSGFARCHPQAGRYCELLWGVTNALK